MIGEVLAVLLDISEGIDLDQHEVINIQGRVFRVQLKDCDFRAAYHVAIRRDGLSEEEQANLSSAKLASLTEEQEKAMLSDMQ